MSSAIFDNRALRRLLLISWWLLPGLLVIVGTGTLFAFPPQPPNTVMAASAVSSPTSEPRHEVPTASTPTAGTPASAAPPPSTPPSNTSTARTSAPVSDTPTSGTPATPTTPSRVSVTLTKFDPYLMEDHSKLRAGWSNYANDVETCLDEVAIPKPFNEVVTITVTPKWNGAVQGVDVADDFDGDKLPKTLSPIASKLRSCFVRHIPSRHQLSMPIVNATGARVELGFRLSAP